MTFTQRQLIERALKGITVLGVGRNATDRDLDIAQPYVQELVDSWKRERLFIYSVERVEFTCVASAASATIGPTGGFVHPVKPIWVETAHARETAADNWAPLDIWRRQRWLNMGNRTQTDTLPRAIYVAPGTTLATIYFMPIPTTACTVALGLPTATEGFADLTTTYAFPEGYHEAFRTALEVRLSRPFGKTVTADMRRDAEVAFGAIKRINDDDDNLLATGELYDRRYDGLVDMQ